MTTVALLDERSRLIGLKKYKDGARIPKDALVVVDEIDLPLDGSYKWMPEDECFMPVGHGYKKPGPPPISTGEVVCLLAQNMDNPPQQVLDWIEWYRGLDHDAI